jgi:folate-dependent phosphoribosylglycinamide formyltransferase PurN
MTPVPSSPSVAWTSLPGDTPESLAERVQACERGLLVAFINDIVHGKIALPFQEIRTGVVRVE